MAAAIVLRSDIDGAGLRVLARASKDAKQVRRLLALAAIYEGSTRSEAARIGGVTLQIVRDWPDCARLGSSLQRAGADRPDRWQGAGRAAAAER